MEVPALQFSDIVLAVRKISKNINVFLKAEEKNFGSKREKKLRETNKNELDSSEKLR